MGKTYEITAGASANNKSITTDNSSNQYFIANSSSTDSVYVRITPSGGNAAVANAAGQYGFIVLPRDTVVITGPQVNPTSNVTVSVISAANTPIVYVTPGEGLR
jgi:hypothetical protein